MSDEELIARLHKIACHIAADRIEALVKENAELTEVFDMQWKCDMRAIGMWREAHPGNELVRPDGAKLTLWLMDLVDKQGALLADAYGADLDWEEVLKQRADHEAVKKIEALEAALREIESISVHSGGEIHGVTALQWELAFAHAQDVASAALKGDDHV